jgi:oligoribonuclease NrnB/cAMP/cGMP phosphodiesterase (DHH superfamily)
MPAAGAVDAVWTPRKGGGGGMKFGATGSGEGNMTPDLCIYHGSCDDGFGAAFAVWKKHGTRVRYRAGVYGVAPPDVTGLNVAIVDFSYKRPIMVELIKKAKGVLVLDHHKTAQADLADLDSELPNVIVEFDMERSGAVMAWQYFHPGTEVPKFFEYLQDRDLWTKRLPGIDEFTAALRSYPRDFEKWDFLISGFVSDLIEEGVSIQRYFRTLVEQAKKHAFTREIAGYTVPVVNASMFMSSEVAGELSEGHPFAAVYADTKDGVIWSLRSRENGIDVSEVAKKFGGGGHKHAAGFTLPRA